MMLVVWGSDVIVALHSGEEAVRRLFACKGKDPYRCAASSNYLLIYVALTPPIQSSNNQSVWLTLSYARYQPANSHLHTHTLLVHICYVTYNWNCLNVKNDLVVGGAAVIVMSLRCWNVS